MNWLTGHNHQQQISLLSQAYRLESAFLTAYAHIDQARQGDTQALRQVQSANDNGIASLHTLIKGSIKQGISASPQALQTELKNIASEWGVLSEAMGLVLQSRAQIQSFADSQTSIRQHINTAINTSRLVTEALNNSLANVDQLYYAARQTELLMSIEKQLLLAQLTLSQRQFQSNDNPLQQLKAEIATLISQFDSNQDYLLSGSTTNQNAQVKNTQVRRLIADNTEQLKAFNNTIGHSFQSQENYENVSSSLIKALERESKTLTQLSNVISEYQQLDELFWLQSWHRFIPIGVLYGLLLWLFGRSLSRSAPIKPTTLSTSAAPLDPPQELTQPNRRKAEQNQLINEIRPLGEGKLYFDATEHNESTKEIARAYNQAKNRISIIAEKAQNRSNSIQKELTQRHQQLYATLDTQLTNLSLAEEDLLKIISSIEQEHQSVIKVEEGLSLSTRIRARLSLAKETLQSLQCAVDQTVALSEFSTNQTIQNTPQTIQNDLQTTQNDLQTIQLTVQTLQNTVKTLLNSFIEAELEQEQLSILLKDNCTQAPAIHQTTAAHPNTAHPTTPDHPSKPMTHWTTTVHNSLQTIHEQQQKALLELQHYQSPIKQLIDIMLVFETKPDERKIMRVQKKGAVNSIEILPTT